MGFKAKGLAGSPRKRIQINEGSEQRPIYRSLVRRKTLSRRWSGVSDVRQAAGH